LLVWAPVTLPAHIKDAPLTWVKANTYGLCNEVWHVMTLLAVSVKRNWDIILTSLVFCLTSGPKSSSLSLLTSQNIHLG
jgi:hypothetical protein